MASAGNQLALGRENHLVDLGAMEQKIHRPTNQWNTLKRQEVLVGQAFAAQSSDD